MRGRKRQRKKNRRKRADEELFAAIRESISGEWARSYFGAILESDLRLGECARRTMEALCGPDETFPIVLVS